jgi:hypothetical protein
MDHEKKSFFQIYPWADLRQLFNQTPGQVYLWLAILNGVSGVAVDSG